MTLWSYHLGENEMARPVVSSAYRKLRSGGYVR
jgi:hypothetical protein